MTVAGISPYNRSSLSYKIVIDPTKDTVSPEDRFEKWVQANPLVSLLATALFFGSVRSLNLACMRCIGTLIDSLSGPVFLLNLGCAAVALGTLVGLIDPKRSPHKAISSVYYTAISSLFVPRFVKNSVWSFTDADVEWKLVNDTTAQAPRPASVCDSQASSCSSDVRSFRIPSSSFARRSSSNSKPGRIQLFSSSDTRQKKETKNSRKLRSRAPSDAPSDATADAPSGVCTPISSPVKRGMPPGSRQTQWEPRMSRIISGKELESLNSFEHESAAMRLAALPERGQIERINESPMSPTASIDSTTSFSRSVSEYVESWLQSLKSGVGAPGTGDLPISDGLHSPQRTSFDGHGAHRHYVRGSVAAYDASLVPKLEKYAIQSQLHAKNKPSCQAYPAQGMNESSAIDSIGLDGDCPDSIRNIVTDEHLLQFGDLVGEKPCSDALKSMLMEQACGSTNALFGLEEGASSLWEQAASGSAEGIEMIVHRRMLRKNYFMYKTDVHIQGLTPQDVRPFHLDDQARSLWDDSAILCRREMPPGESRISKHAESCLQRYVSRFPRPLSARRYEYARRVWTRPSDGGCYAISKSCVLPTDTSLPSKYVLVKEYVSACLIKSTPTGTRIVTVYFEDSQVRPGLAKMAVPKGLWPFWTKYEVSLRFFAKAKHVNSSNRKSLDGAPPSNQEDKHMDTSVDARNPDSASEYDSDDEIYDALARIKEHKRTRSQTTGPGDLPRWIRRVLVAGAIKLVHESMRK